jgi:hypothetical protein
MRVENIVMALEKRRKAMSESVFSTPPADHNAFIKQQGIWQGLSEALNIISEEVRKEVTDD